MTSSPEGFPPQDLRSFLELCAGEWLALRSHFDLALVDPADPAASADAEAGAAAASAASRGETSGSTSPGLNAASAPGSDMTPSAAAADAAASDPPPAGGSLPDAPGDAQAEGLPDFAALLQQARAEVEEAPVEEAWHRSERAELQVVFLAPAVAGEPGGLRVTPPQGASRELHFRADGSFASAADELAAPAGQWQLWPDGSVELTVEAPGRVLRERIWFTQPNLRLRSSVEHSEAGRPGRARFSSEIRRVRKPAA